ncbi:MAG: hypothetical protein PHO75_03375 [Candidatus Shapirobacteria bacterium]|nr:hypothetical protein [Candidatus Shapirobacteria bacterium]
MDIENNYEQELVFQVKVENKEDKQNYKQKKVVKMASKNFRKLVMSRIEGKTGEC